MASDSSAIFRLRAEISCCSDPVLPFDSASPSSEVFDRQYSLSLIFEQCLIAQANFRYPACLNFLEYLVLLILATFSF
jgi:hypothetical protein